MVGLDTHVVLVKEQGGAPVPMQHPFSGPLEAELSETVFIDDEPVATVGSIARNVPVHIPVGGPFAKPPTNEGTVSAGSDTVFVEHVAIARANDPVACCNDPLDTDTGHIIATGTVYAG